MAKVTHRTRHVGVDVSAKTLFVAMDDVEDIGEFDNTPAGHKALVRKATKGGRAARIVVEATGAYHFELACCLADASRVEVMVANPRDTAHFHQAQGIRAKTDRVDARSLLEFARRMTFVPWTKPADHLIELRAASRYLDQLVKDRTRLLNQQHALATGGAAPSWMREQLEKRLDELQRTIAFAEKQLVAMARANDDTAEIVGALTTIPGVGETTAVHLVAEFSVLPLDMTSKQVTAWAGLDPRPKESGTSVRGRRGISKRGNARVRHILYMPAMNAVRYNPVLNAFHERVSARAAVRHVGLIAVMRKLLVICWAIRRTREPWRPELAAPKTADLAVGA